VDAHLIYPSGNVATYYYDFAGRLTQVDLVSGDPAQTTILASNIAYVPFGPMTGLT
jgi:hypothetical protein